MKKGWIKVDNKSILIDWERIYKMDNKFPGKDITNEDLISKFPLAAKKSTIFLNLKSIILCLVEE